MKLTECTTRLGTESAFDVLARAKALEATGRDIVHLEIGEPDFDTPEHIVEAAVEALRAGYTHYVPAPGIPELRQSVADFLARTGRLHTTPERVLVAPGAKPVMFLAMLALCQQGDEVICPDPGYPIYESLASFLGAKAVPIPLREQNGFRLDPEELRSLVTPRTKLIVLNSPHNPCGASLTRDDLAAVAEIAKQHDLMVLSDEVYWAIAYGAKHASILDIDGMAERTILVDGWSKTFAMTGWRLGFGVFPQAMVPTITRLLINTVSCTSAFSQRAAIAALEGPWQPVQQMVEEFRRRRDIIVAGLNRIPGVSCLVPDGAFYAFANVKELGASDKDVQNQLMEGGVACLAGSDFGRSGAGYVRFSFANSVENIEKALGRIEDVLAAVHV